MTESEEWYWPDGAKRSKNMPIFRLLDTESSHGRYAGRSKIITVKDLVKFHGHPCDGLFRGAYAMSVGLKILFPDGIVDRTDLRFLSRNSPCLGDVGEYLTGGRVRFGTQDVLNREGVWYIIQRMSDGTTVEVKEDPDFFDPKITVLESNLNNFKGQELSQSITELKKEQERWLENVLFKAVPEEHYHAQIINFSFPDVPYANKGTRTDITYKNID